MLRGSENDLYAVASPCLFVCLLGGWLWLVGFDTFFCLFCFVLFIVRVAPQITTQPQSGPVTEGNNVTLSCNASGNPVPAISWTRDGSTVSSGDQRISFEAGNRRLAITNVSRADSGEYRCVADNSEGSDTSNATTLDVQCKYTSLIKDLTKLPKTEFLAARLLPRILAR